MIEWICLKWRAQVTTQILVLPRFSKFTYRVTYCALWKLAGTKQALRKKESDGLACGVWNALAVLIRQPAQLSLASCPSFPLSLHTTTQPAGNIYRASSTSTLFQFYTSYPIPDASLLSLPSGVHNQAHQSVSTIASSASFHLLTSASHPYLPCLITFAL